MTLSSIGSIEFVGKIEWDGKAIVVGAATPFGRVSCRIPRETIHALPIYSDALEREIRLERHLILERLAPAQRAKISVSGTANQWICGLGRSAAHALRPSRALYPLIKRPPVNCRGRSKSGSRYDWSVDSIARASSIPTRQL